MRPVSQYAARIRAARAFAGLRQEDLADRLGVDPQTIKRRESGEQDPKKGERVAIAAICGVPEAFMEDGFGIAFSRDEIADRLERIEAALTDGLGEQRKAIIGLMSDVAPAELAPEGETRTPPEADDPSTQAEAQ